ncbi:uncharacterized protein A4U43_C07F30750 [Asparagus officinalis]|uniref:Uncharacterized protein n=1 Tax=Asparagus officinalis TaxID=4686 RepID=A0A5P1EG77_ASPOF|nr:uncharacterized protein A4U43_C07F30750 [Asparagus officinalis]
MVVARGRSYDCKRRHGDEIWTIGGWRAGLGCCSGVAYQSGCTRRWSRGGASGYGGGLVSGVGSDDRWDLVAGVRVISMGEIRGVANVFFHIDLALFGTRASGFPMAKQVHGHGRGGHRGGSWWTSWCVGKREFGGQREPMAARSMQCGERRSQKAGSKTPTASDAVQVADRRGV